jgi:hypothetical protein
MEVGYVLCGAKFQTTPGCFASIAPHLWETLKPMWVANRFYPLRI